MRRKAYEPHLAVIHYNNLRLINNNILGVSYKQIALICQI